MIKGSIAKWLRTVGFGRKALYRKGIACFNLGKYEEALTLFGEITDQQPVSYSLHHYLARFYSALACVNVGVLYLFTGQNRKAVGFLERAIEFSPKQFAPFYYLGIAYNNLGRFDKAMESFNRVTQINPDLLGVKAKIALVFHNEARYQDAEALLEKMVREHPEWPDMSYHLGLVKATLGRGEEGLAELERAVGVNPNYLKARIGRAILLARQGRGLEAASVLEEVARERPGFADVHFHLGIVKAYLGHLDEAEDILKKTLDINSMYIKPRFFLGLVQAARGKFSEAEKSIRDVLLLEPNHQEAKLIVGHLERLSRDPSEKASQHFLKQFADQARLQFPKNLEIFPDFSDIVNIFSPQENRSLYQSMIRLLEATVETHPDYADVFENLGVLYSKMADHEKAVFYFGKSLDANPKFIRARMNRYRSLMALGMVNKALEDMDELMARGLDFPDLHYDRGQALNALGRSDEAGQALERAIAIHPRMKPAFLLWSLIEEQRGNWEKAIEILENFLETLEHTEAEAEMLSRIEQLRIKKVRQ